MNNQKTYYIINRRYRIKYQQNYYKINKERIKKYNHEYYLKNKEILMEKHRQYAKIYNQKNKRKKRIEYLKKKFETKKSGIGKKLEYNKPKKKKIICSFD
jgi:hypothetical protein